jgi:hypothetical protein
LAPKWINQAVYLLQDSFDSANNPAKTLKKGSSEEKAYKKAMWKAAKDLRKGILPY